MRQPGPPAPVRVAAIPVGCVAVDTVLPAGVDLLEGLAGLLEGGVESACLRLEGGGLGPFAYVIPALSPDGRQAAFYSETRRPAAPVRLEAAAVTLGWRDGAPFFHCHALWAEADGQVGCGHVLPGETRVAAPIRVRGAGMVGGRFEARPDAETGFTLFTPVATVAVPAGMRPGVAVRVAPNQELAGALEAAAAGLGPALVQGGVASTIGARFVDAPETLDFATELLVRHGETGGTAGTVLEIAIVDLHGTIGAGRLVNGDNPVLMTFEGLLEARDDV